jgi:hypothetical protein
MLVPVGKHKGKSAESLVLKEPGYVHWLQGQTATGPLLALQKEVQNLIKKFDQRPFHVKCNGNACSAQASRLSVYGDSISPYWWCDSCDPYQMGAIAGKLQIFRSYSSALTHVEFFCAGRQSDYKELVKAIAQAKGLPSRVGESQAAAFFK